MAAGEGSPPRRRWAAAAGLALLWVAALGCRTTAEPGLGRSELDAALRELSRPLTADPAALYRLRVPASGGLRVSLVTSGTSGRMTVSEPFGSAVSITAWRAFEPPVLFDLREGCRLEGVDLSRVLGLASLPLPQAVLLLSGRLPAGPEDDVRVSADGALRVVGEGWSSELRLAADPWRVVSVREAGVGGDGWSVELADHAGSIPGRLRIERGDGRWLELELMTLEWNRDLALPSLPDLPPCGPGSRP